VFSWKEDDDGKLVGPMCFFPLPTKILSLQFGVKIEGKGNQCLNYPPLILLGRGVNSS